MSSPRHETASTMVASTATMAEIHRASGRPTGVNTNSGTWTHRKATNANATEPSRLFVPSGVAKAARPWLAPTRAATGLATPSSSSGIAYSTGESAVSR